MKKPRVIMTLSNPFKIDPRVYKEALTLVENGYSVTVLAWDREGVHPREENVDGIEVKRIRIRSKYGSILSFVVSLPMFYLKAAGYLIRNREEYDVIHTHDFDTAVLGAFGKLILKKKWVFDIHDIYFTRISLLKERASRGFLQEVLKWLEVTFAKYADIVVVVTRSLGGHHEGFKEFYTKAGVPPDRIKVIWNTPKASMFLNFPRLDLKKSSKFTIGYIGSIRTVSNFVPLFEVARRRGYRLLFVGGGKSKKAVEKLAREQFPDVEAEFTGSVPYNLIPNYYLICDALYSYFPPTENVKRTITVKLFEAAFLGVPTVVTGDSLMEDFVRLYQCGVPVVELSQEALDRAIEELKELRISPRRVREKWVWEKQEECLISIYSSLCGDETHGSPDR